MGVLPDYFQPGAIASQGYDEVKNFVTGPVTPTKPDLSASDDARKRSQALAAKLEAERGSAQPTAAPQLGAPPVPGAPNPGGMAYNLPGAHGQPAVPPPPNTVDNTQSQQTRTQQQDALDALKAAANGTVPSAAELQMRQQASRNAAQQYALAATLQGRSPGGALRQASIGDAMVQGQTNADAGTLRATEQANARNAYTTALGGVRGQDQQTELANLNAKLTAMGYDVQTKNAILAAQLQAQGYDVSTANAIIAAQTAAADSANKFKGGVIGTAGAVGAALLPSDERAKTDIADANMGEFLEALEPKLFKYKDQKHGEGQRIGIMAQDAAKTKVGRDFVVGGGEDLMQLDVGNALGAALAASAALHKRVKALEAR